MLPTAGLTVDDLLLILRRRAGLVIVTVAVVSAATAGSALLLPNHYRSETLILVLPRRVPETYVKSTVTARIEDRLQSIAQEILSRTRLEHIIRDFDLYAAERRTQPIEAVVENMRRHIDVRVVKDDSFRVAYIGDNPQTVMRVTNGLAALFIEEQLRDREELADETNHFLQAQLADARQRLGEHEKKLEQYRSRFSGELPSQLASNLQVIQNLQLQIQSLTDSAGRDDDRRTLLQRELRAAERELESDTPAAAAPDAAPRRSDSGSTAAALESARSELAAMEQRLAAAHPDLQRMRDAVRALESTAASEATSRTNVEAHPAPQNPQAAVRRARVADLRIELEQLDRQLALKRAEETRLREIGQRYEQRIERAPARESELAELTRDYSTLQGVYQTLLAKQEESKIAANLERRQIGAQFKLLDPARAAEKPSGPRRWLINLAGIAAGLAFALALVICLEYRDRTLNSDEEVKHELLLPVLAVVPLVESDEERRTHLRRRVLATGAVAGLVTLCVPIVIYSCLQ